MRTFGGTASGTHTQMTWNTPDIEAAVADLKARGVVFCTFRLRASIMPFFRKGSKKPVDAIVFAGLERGHTINWWANSQLGCHRKTAC